MLIEFISSFRCLSVLFYFKDCANIAPDVALRLFLRRLRLCKFVFTAMAIPKSSPPLSLIRLFDKSSRSTNEFYSIASANALAEASRNSLCIDLTSLIEDAVYRASPRATPPKSPNLQQFIEKVWIRELLTKLVIIIMFFDSNWLQSRISVVRVWYSHKFLKRW